VYYLDEAQSHLNSYRNGGSELDLIEGLYSVRQGWVRSSGVALEKAYEHIYNPTLSSSYPPVYLVLKARIRRDSVGRQAVNLGIDGIGEAREDDAYLVTVDPQERVHVFGAVQIKASVGDRADQGGPRSSVMMELGYFSAVFTLDPMEVGRSPSGMLVHPSYIATVNGTTQQQNAWHYVYVGRNANRHRPAPPGVYSRIKEVDLRNQPDTFDHDCRRAATDWLSHGHRIPVNWT